MLVLRVWALLMLRALLVLLRWLLMLLRQLLVLLGLLLRLLVLLLLVLNVHPHPIRLLPTWITIDDVISLVLCLLCVLHVETTLARPSLLRPMLIVAHVANALGWRDRHKGGRTRRHRPCTTTATSGSAGRWNPPITTAIATRTARTNRRHRPCPTVGSVGHG